MNLAVSIAKHERDMALRWLEWVAELGQNAGHRLFLLPNNEMDVTEIVTAAEKAFPAAVNVLRDAENIQSDWQGPNAARSAAGPNSALRQFAWHFHYANLGPWLWIELDAIPLKPGWIDALEAEYQRGGKPFMGAEVKIERVPPHLSGNAVYAQNVPELAPSLIMRTNWISEGKEYELAFDIAGAKEVLPQAHFTNLIQHKFRHPGFKTREEFEATIDPAAVVFHSNKDGSIFPFLRKQDEPIPGTVELPSPFPPRFEYLNGEYVRMTESTAGPINSTYTTVGDTSRESLVRDTVAILKQLCTSPVHISKVRKELKAQGVIR